MQYETAPAVAMGLGAEFGFDHLLVTQFFKAPVVDALLSAGFDPDSEPGTIEDRHPRFKELEEAGRIDGPHPEWKHHFVISRADMLHYREAEFVRIIRRGEDPADVNGNMPEFLLCDHPVGKVCRQRAACYKNRFAERYAKWKAGQDADLASGLPLSEVPFIDSARRAELEHRNVRTAEQLLDLPADVTSRVRGLLGLQDRVRKFMAAIQGQREDEVLEKKLAERDARIAELEARLDAVSALPDIAEKAPRSKGGRFAKRAVAQG